MSQADLTGFRGIRIEALDAARALPPSQANTDPDFTMSPFAPSEMPTTGLLLMLQSPSVGNATALAGGFSITPWIRDPVSKYWGSGATFSAAYGQLFTTFDFDAGELWFQIENVNPAGGPELYLFIAEQ